MSQPDAVAIPVVLLTANHLCHNPRVQKEAAALAGAGFDVEILGAWTDPTLAAQDREMLAKCTFGFTPIVDFTVPDLAATFSRQLSRIQRKVGVWTHRTLSRDNRWQLGTLYPALRRAAFRRQAKLYIAHSEAALAVAYDLHREGRLVAVDMEDWFSEDLLPEARRERPLGMLRRFESTVLAEGAFASCPSHAMSRALASEFGCPPPTVIYNAFSWAEHTTLDGISKDRPKHRCPSIHWVSQTLGAGRGLEDLFAALRHLTHEAEIHLRGKPMAGFAAWLAERVPETWRDRVIVHGTAPNEELVSRIAEHDIGFAGEMKFCRSRDLTVTNKILQYLLAGLAVVASDTAGQREVAEQADGAVLLYPAGDAAALALRLDELLGSAERLKQTKAAALIAAQKTFCWERQASVLLDTVTTVLCRSPDDIGSRYAEL